MKFTFRWLMVYDVYNRYWRCGIEHRRSYRKTIEADDIDAAVKAFKKNRRRPVTSFNSITDEHGTEYVAANGSIKGVKVPPVLLMDRMVTAMREGYEVKVADERVTNAVTRRPIKYYIDLGDGITVHETDLFNVELGSDERPYMTYEQIVKFFKKCKKGGVWSEYGHCEVVRDWTDGHSVVGFTSRNTMNALQADKVLGPNQYGGFKQRGAYPYVPPEMEAPKRIVPLWQRVDNVATRIGNAVGLPSPFFRGEALDVVMREEGLRK